MTSDATERARALGIPSPRPVLFRLAIVFVVLLVVGAGVAVYLRSRTTPTVSYVTSPTRRGGITSVVTATGSLSATDTVTIGAEISGRVRAVHVDENDRVTRGQLLLELDATLYESGVRESAANVAAAEATLALARATFEEASATESRTRTLREQDLASEQDRVSSHAAAARATAEVASAQARLGVSREALRQARTNLERTRIVSPIDGVVLSRSVEPGQTVVASLQAPVLFELAEDLRRMRLRVRVDEADVGHVHEGQHATFTVDAYPERTFQATVTKLLLAPETVNGVVTYEATMVVDNSELLLRPGMTATASIVTERREGGLLVPNAALRYEPTVIRSFGGGSSRAPARDPRAHVYLVRGGRPVKVHVTVLASDETTSEIRGSGIREGTEVVVDQTSARPGGRP